MLIISPALIAGEIVNINAVSNCKLSNSVTISLDEGTWLITPTNPSIDAEANFIAWSAWTDQHAWLNRVHLSSVDGIVTLGTGDYFPSAQLAFDDPNNLPVKLELDVPDVVKFYVSDSSCSDNSGGISVRIKKTYPPTQACLDARSDLAIVMDKILECKEFDSYGSWICTDPTREVATQEKKDCLAVVRHECRGDVLPDNVSCEIEKVTD